MLIASLSKEGISPHQYGNMACILSITKITGLFLHGRRIEYFTMDGFCTKVQALSLQSETPHWIEKLEAVVKTTQQNTWYNSHIYTVRPR